MDNRPQVRHIDLDRIRYLRDNDPNNVRIVSASTAPKHKFIPPIYADYSAKAVAERIRNARS